MSNNLVINFVLNFDYKVGGSKRVERKVTNEEGAVPKQEIKDLGRWEEI